MLGHEFVFLQCTFGARPVDSFVYAELLNCLQQDSSVYYALAKQHPEGEKMGIRMQKAVAASFKKAVYEEVKKLHENLSNDLFTCRQERDYGSQR